MWRVRCLERGIVEHSWTVVVAYLCEFGYFSLGASIVKVIVCNGYDAHGWNAGCDFCGDSEAIHRGVERVSMEMWCLVDWLMS